MTAKAQALLDNLVIRISAETVVPFVRDTLFSDGITIPCIKWSLLNQFMVHLAGTRDARGIKQWRDAGRRLVKGAQALYILVPMILKPKDKPEAEGEDKSVPGKLVGFRVMPVFRVEDTEGSPLDYELKMRDFDVASLPLIEVARTLGVSVSTSLTRGYSGAYSQKSKAIILGSANPQVFLHELSHAVDHALPDRQEGYDFGEVVAELSACFLGSLYGVPVDIGSTQAYIEHYAGRGHVAFKVIEALDRVKAIYRYIEAHRTHGRRRKVRTVSVQRELIA